MFTLFSNCVECPVRFETKKSNLSQFKQRKSNLSRVINYMITVFSLIIKVTRKNMWAFNQNVKICRKLLVWSTEGSGVIRMLSMKILSALKKNQGRE